MLDSAKNEKCLRQIRTENQKAHFVFGNISFPENRAVYEIMWKNIAERNRATDGNITRRMRIACRITKTTNTHPEYVMLIAFPQQQWLRERALMLRYTYIDCLLTVM